MNRTEKISIDTIKKIISINRDVANFSAEIKISAATDNEFFFAVLSQTLLENTEDVNDIPYKKASKTVLFTVRNENNLLQPYVLVLKSGIPQEVIVSINLQELPINNQISTVEKIDSVDYPWYKDWRYWVVIFIILSIFAFFYWKMNRKPEPAILLTSKPPLSPNNIY